MKDATTPRTNDYAMKVGECNMADFARQLERELATLRAELDWVRDVTAEHGYDGPQGEACSPLRDWLREWAQLRRESAEPDRENARLLGEIAATCLKRKEDLRRCAYIAQQYPFSLVAGMEIGNAIRKEFPEAFK